MATDPVVLGVKMIERRDDMKRLLGKQYGHQVSVARAILRGVAAERRLPLAKAALELAREMSNARHNPSIIIAALVDEAQERGGA